MDIVLIDSCVFSISTKKNHYYW